MRKTEGGVVIRGGAGGLGKGRPGRRASGGLRRRLGVREEERRRGGPSAGLGPVGAARLFFVFLNKFRGK